MKVKITYYGMLTDIAATSEEVFNIEGTSLEVLKDALYTKHPGLKGVQFQIAQNNQIITGNHELMEGGIDLLPPFSGG